MRRIILPKALRVYMSRFQDHLLVILPLAVLTMVLALSFGLPALRDTISGSLWQDLRLRYPVYADIDNRENLFVIDDNSRRIVSIGPNGRERWILEGGRRSKGFYETYRLAAVGDGGVVAYNYIRDPVDDSKSGEQFVRFGSDGKYLGVLVNLEFPPGKRESDDELLGSLRVQNGFLYYTYHIGKRFELLKRPIDPAVSGVAPAGHEKVLSTDLGIDLVAFAAHPPEGMVVADRAGSLFVLRPDGGLAVPPFARNAGVKAFDKPWDIKVGPAGEVYVLDNFRDMVSMATSLDATVATEVFSERTVLAKGRQTPSFEGIAISPGGTLGVVDKFNHSVFLLSADGGLRIVTGGVKLDTDHLGSWSLVILDVAALALSVAAVIGLLRRLFEKRTSLIVKQVLFFLPLVVISVSVGSFAIYRIMDNSFRKELGAKVTMVAGLGARLIDGELIERITRASDWDGAAHRALGKQFTEVLNGNNDAWDKDLRTVIYKYQDDKFYFVKNHSSYYGVMFPYGGAQSAHFAAARGGTVESAQYSDEYGTYISGMAPVRTAAGRITGVLEVYLNYNTVSENTTAFLGELFQGILIVTLTVILLLVAIDILIFLSLGYLRNASHRLMKGELGITVRVTRRDEIGDLARDFNTMSERIKSYFDRLKEIQDANGRFVPLAFLEFLEKESIADVVSGDQTRRRMTVFLSDIRSFTSLSEGMTPKENFDFINSYFSVMGPVIRAHGGFIDRYLGDAIMALFPRSPKDAVEAGLEMRKVLVDFNAGRVALGKAPVDFGVGLHCEKMVFGIVGEANRLSATIFSEAVDLVGQLEAATKKHGVGMVITRSVLDELPLALRNRSTPLGTLEGRETLTEIFGI